MVRLGHRSPQPDVVGASSSSSSQQPAAAASSTGLRDTREGGERGARGGSSAGGQPEGGTVPLWKAARLPRNHGVGAVVLAAARGRAAAAARALGGGSGSATRSCVAAEGARRLSRPLACLARAAAPPGGVADLGGCPKQRGIQGPDARSTIAVESKIGVDLGGFFVVFVVAIWRWRKRLKFNVENSVGAPWLLSARQKLAR